MAALLESDVLDEALALEVSGELTLESVRQLVLRQCGISRLDPKCMESLVNLEVS